MFELVLVVQHCIVGLSVHPHAVDDFEPTLTQATQGIGVTTTFLAMMAVVDFGPETPGQKVILRLLRTSIPTSRRPWLRGLCRKSLDQVDRAFPTVEDGVKGLAFVEAAVRSSASHRWEPLESPAI